MEVGLKLNVLSSLFVCLIPNTCVDSVLMIVLNVKRQTLK